MTTTAGQATSLKGRYHNVAKNVLRGYLANGLKTQLVILAHDHPLCERIHQELESLEVKTTAAGNQVLDASRTDGHHADHAIAAAIAIYHSNVGAGFSGEAAIAGYWG